MNLPVDGRHELHYAALDGDCARVRELVALGVPVDVADHHGWTPLFFAAARRNVEVAELLIGLGAVVDHVDDFGNTPLFRAVYEAGPADPIVAVFLDAGADPDRPNARGVTPRTLAGHWPGADELGELSYLRIA